MKTQTDKASNCYCAHCKCNRAFVFDCISDQGVEKHRCLACGHLYSTISSASVVSDNPNQSNETRARFYTTSVVIKGALCGHIWMPATKCTLSITEDLHARFNRFSDKAGATFRDALLSTLNEKGGDFQSAQFTADTSLVITRCKFIGGSRSTRFETRIREIPLSELPDCADLVDAETYSYDGEFDDTSD